MEACGAPLSSPLGAIAPQASMAEGRFPTAAKRGRGGRLWVILLLLAVVVGVVLWFVFRSPAPAPRAAPRTPPAATAPARPGAPRELPAPPSATESTPR
jgi:hypothetical protein